MLTVLFFQFGCFYILPLSDHYGSDCQESEVTQSCLTLWLYGLLACSLFHPWDFLGKYTGVGCHFLLQGIFPTQRVSLDLLHCRLTLYHLSHQATKTMLNKNKESRHSCFFPHFRRETFSFSSLNMMLVMGFS